MADAVQSNSVVLCDPTTPSQQAKIDADGQAAVKTEPTTSLGHGVKTITTAGTDEALAGSTACQWVIVQAQTDNTGYIAVGATGVDGTVATGSGVLLSAGRSTTIIIDNLSKVYIDSTVNGEGVRYMYGAA